ncbi:MAG: TonB-dependent receptor [Gammaproteobacteria bacterium]|nr:TonB-dependent receptor [Gammaproteobacteria bacterium]
MSTFKKLSTGLVVTALTVLHLPFVTAEESEDGKSESDAELLIITGVAQPTTKLKSTNSVTALQKEEIVNFAPRSTAEIFRNLPGIQSEHTGGDSNANIKIRGLPISAGGARYLSIQEDSLPVLLIGDLEFGTSDSFLRFDNSVYNVQAIRGGASATQASNSAGGIVNFLSNQGDEESGSVSLTAGLDYDATRVDFNYGQALDGDWLFHIGGFIRDGEGARDVRDSIESGYQIKANATKEMENGFVRLHLKLLDDNSPTFLPIPAVYNGSGFDSVGMDLHNGSLYFTGTDILNRTQGRQPSSLTMGFQAETTAFGIEGDFEVADGTSILFNHRTASNSGQFVSPFPAELYENEDGVAARIHYFNTKLDSLNNSLTNLNVKFDFDNIRVKAGVFVGSQDYVAQWGWNTYFRQVNNEMTPVEGPDGEPSDMPGHPAWGNCCSRSYDIEIENTAPNLTLAGDIGDDITWDASYRRDTWEVAGRYAFSGPADADGYLTYGDYSPVDYELSYNSWSVGMNYSLSAESAIFGSASSGGSATAPSRITGSVLANGDLDSERSGYSLVDQIEFGYKYRGDDTSVYVTVFNAETAEAGGFEVTTQRTIENTYESTGVEVEAAIDFDNGFSLAGGFTITDTEIVDSNNPDHIGNQPRRQSDFIYNITPAYTTGDHVVGINFYGTDDVYIQDDNQGVFDGFIVANLFWNYQMTDSVSLSLNVNNLFDEVAFTEGEEGGALSVGQLVRIRPINGRTGSLSIRYDF